MKKLRALVFSLILAMPQVLAPFAAAQAPAPPPSPPPPPPPRQSSPPPERNQDSHWGMPSMSVDVCGPKALTQTWLPPTMSPPREWRGKFVKMYADIKQDGSVADVKLIGATGDAEMTAAALAQVKQNWRWAPLNCDRTKAGQNVSVAFPRATCFPMASPGSTPMPPLILAQPRRGISAAVWIMVTAEGRVADASIDVSSGDAALDAALLAHVRQNWRYYPFADGCPAYKARTLVRFPESDCITRPLPESRTAPKVTPGNRPRAVELQVGVAPDGKPLFANVLRSSGDAALDMAAVEHVKAAWRWEPITCARAQPALTDKPPPVVDTVQVAFP